ncbi:MAG TPA: MMPL family transporter [Verrucomicrobiae bacterium]
MKAARHLLLAILCALAIIGIFRLRIDVDILNLLPADNSISRGLAEYQEKFLQAGEVIMVVQTTSSASSEGAVKEIVKALKARPELVGRVFWQPPANESLNDAAQFLAYLWLNAPTNSVAELRTDLQRESLETLLLASKERIATSFSPRDMLLAPRDPLNLSRLDSVAGETFETPEKFFSSEDGYTRLIYIYSAVPLNNYEQCREWLRELRRVIAPAVRESHRAEIKVSLTGRPVFVDEISSGMRSDMATAIPGTLFLIGVLFYLLHREWISLALLLTTLFGIMLWTALAGSAVLGQLNVVSVGFASILLGLAEDFGIVLHQELKSHPGQSADSIRKIAGPGIFWSAVTTASAFALLNLSSLPGLKHLGTLVALGIIIGAWAMSYIFLPLLIRFRTVTSEDPPKLESKFSLSQRSRLIPTIVTMVLFVAACFSLVTRLPRLDASPDVLRPRDSEASAALKMVQSTIGTSGDPFWLLFHGNSEVTIRRDLELMDAHLSENAGSLGIANHTLPLAVWPEPAHQFANAPALKEIASEQERIFATVVTNGFTPEALDLSRTVFAEWRRFNSSKVNWPEGRVADWVLPKFVSREGTNLVALALVTPGSNFVSSAVIPESLHDRVLLSGWSLLGRSVLQQVTREVPIIFTLVALTVVIALWLTFRKISGVLLSLGVLAFSGLVLLSIMSALGWRWNLINLVALPLLLAMGVDYSIHMQTALSRYEGNFAGAFHTVGRALLLAGSTTIIGFAFLGTSSNLGMASLGRVCALGLTILLLTSVFLLPAWVRLTHRSAAK